MGNVGWQLLHAKEQAITQVTNLLETTRHEGQLLTKWLRRPEFQWEQIVALLPELATTTEEVAQQVTYDVKYSGYIERQQVEVDRQRRMSKKKIPDSFDYATIPTLRNEAREKFVKIRPTTLAQAGRISGITPADLALVMAYLDHPRKPATDSESSSETSC